MPRAKIRRLLKFVDWIVRLPEDLGNQVFVELEKIEKVNNMAYVTSFERIGIKRGMEKGMKMGLEQGLSDIDLCKKLLREAVRASSMEDFEAKLEHHS